MFVGRKVGGSKMPELTRSITGGIGGANRKKNGPKGPTANSGCSRGDGSYCTTRSVVVVVNRLSLPSLGVAGEKEG